jgi:hypothetical protein
MTLNEQPERARDPLMEAIGRVTVAGAQLDAALHGLLGTIAFEPTLLKHTNGASTDQLIQFCRLALTVGTIAEPDVKEIAACLDKADNIRKRRNTVVHSLYMQAETGNGVEALKPVRKNLGYLATPITPDEMEDLADEVTVLRDDMFRAGWNSKAGKMPGMQPIPPRAPGQRVNGVLPKA